MSKNKRLHFKDLDTLRFFAFIPVFLYCVLYLSRTSDEGFHHELTGLIGFIKTGSFDFFFFVSAFLLTSQGLREYKYNNSFSLKNFYLRKFMRLAPLTLVALTFAFIFYPLIIKTLKLNVTIMTPGSAWLQLIPEYFSVYGREHYICLAIIWVILMFAQFYFVWGIVLKLGRKTLTIISFVLIFIGIATRIIYTLMDISWEFSVLSYGVPVGVATILAQLIRNDSPYLEKIRVLPKRFILPIYIIGTILLITGYLISGGFFVQSFVPLIMSAFFSFMILDQTFGKNSPFKFRNNKVFTHLGKISFGLFIYQAILSVLIVIGIDSLDFDIDSVSTKLALILLSFVMSWIVADISFNFIEKPLLRLRREFKAV